MSLAPRQGRVPSAAHSYTAPSPPRHLLPTSCRSFGCRRRHAPCVAAARPRHKAQKALRAEARSSAHVWPQQPQVPLHAHTRQTRSVSARASAASSAASPEHSGAPVHGSQWRARWRAINFYCFSMAVAIPLFVIMLALAPFMAAFDRHRRLAQHFVNDVWARISTLFFYKVTVDGWDNLPKNTEAAVYIANHQSFLDIFTLFQLDRPFKFVSKTSNFLIPIVGWSMFLTGHIPLNRMDRKSQVQCLADCRAMLAKGASVLFFPEGTRSLDARLASFKKGAFTVAARAKVPVVPITITGTGDIMPSQRENFMYPGHVHVTIHPRIPPGSADKMLAASRHAIASAMPPHLVDAGQ